jgi:hypothetical protein
MTLAFWLTLLATLWLLLILRASGKGNSASASILKLIFQAVNWSLIADNTATTPLTNLYVSLHTANPGATGNQQTSEAAYTSYARVAVARTSSGWAISGQTITPVATIVFPAATGGSETETYAGIGTTLSAAGVLLYFGQITPSIVMSSSVTPELTTASSVTEA